MALGTGRDVGMMYGLELFDLTEVETEPQRDDLLKIRGLIQQPC